jgi:hypothetical protein
VVISTLEAPLHGPGDASLPVLHSTTGKHGEGGQIVTDEAHALGLNDSVYDDRIPNSGG